MHPFVSCMRIHGRDFVNSVTRLKNTPSCRCCSVDRTFWVIVPTADDVVEYFVQKSIANGIDIIRIFDCLNDLRNLQTAVKAANKENGHAQVALSYTLGDAYTLEYWTTMAKEIEEMGANSICIKDMAGLLLPYKATELVKALKETVKIPIQLHTHYTSGVASMTYLKGSRGRRRRHRLRHVSRLLWVLPSRQPRLWLRPSRELPMIQAMIRSFWLRLRITSVRCVTRLWRAAC